MNAVPERDQIARELTTKAAIDALFVAVYLCQQAGWHDVAATVAQLRFDVAKRARAEQGQS